MVAPSLSHREPVLVLLQWIVQVVERAIVWLSWRAVRPSPVGPAEPAGNALGRLADSGEPFALRGCDLDRHCYVLGSTGCGKTSLILKLLEDDIGAGHTVAVVDLRGDLVSGVLALSGRMGIDPERVSLLDLRDREPSRGFDPLSGAGEPYVRALHVLDVLATEAESWGVQLEESLRNALLLLSLSGNRLTDLDRLFFDGRFREGCLKAAGDETLVSFWDRYGALSAEKQRALAVPALNKVTPLLAVPVLRRVLGHPCGMDLGHLLAKPRQIILVSLAVDELQRSGRMLGSLVVSAISREMMSRVNVPEGDRNPVRLYVDEFENMASDSFEGLIAEGRRFGLTLVLSHQTLSQLPARLRSVVRNNVGIQMLFQCGFEDSLSLGRELPSDLRLDDGLRGLGVGEAVVMRRDGTADLVKFAAPTKAPPAKATASYRESVRGRSVAASPGRLDPSLPPEEPLRFGSEPLEEWL